MCACTPSIPTPFCGKPGCAGQVSRPVTSYGWLRRPEKDWRGVEVWERPNGVLYAAPAGSGPPVIVEYWR